MLERLKTPSWAGSSRPTWPTSKPGRPPTRERLLAAHPAIAGQLRACLQVMNLADRMVDASGSASAGASPCTLTWIPQWCSPGQSVLTTLGSDSGTLPQVHLRDLPDEPEPLVKPRSAEMPAPNGASLGRYQLQGEIARGGMGAILKGRDVDLGRDLAIKVLLESHQGQPRGRQPVYRGGADRRPACSIPGSCRCTSWERFPSPTAGLTSP